MSKMFDLEKNGKKLFIRFSFFLLVYNLFVILFGALVRATGSGAGCGAHWPLCNGVVVPQAPVIETVIEYTHRLTSGLTLLLAIVLVFLAFRIYSKRSKIRIVTILVLFFTLVEALIGAGLVLLGLVAENDSVARAVVVGLHLINTFLLIGSNVLTWEWSRKSPPVKISIKLSLQILVVFLALGLLILGASGAITALGDTLFPSSSLAEGIAQDFANDVHFLIELRVFHPLIAAVNGLFIYGLFFYVKRIEKSHDAERYFRFFAGAFIVQIFVGVVNVLLLAPVWMQLIHLFLADTVWILFILTINQLAVDSSLPSSLQTEPSN